MKNIFIGVLSIAFIILINSCSSNKEPQVRVKNEQVNKVTVTVKTSAGNKFSIDVEPGQTTSYQKTSEGNITVTNIIQNESVSFPAAKNSNYTIVISAGKPPSLQVD